MKPAIKLYAVLAIIGGIAFGLSLLFGITPCIIYHVTGLPCPACGLTRAFLALVRFDVPGAFTYHPLFFIVPVLPLIAHERFSPKKKNILSFAVLGMFFVAWGVRMVLYFPHTPPMEFNENSLFWWIFG